MMPWSKAMAYPAPKGIGEAAVGSGMAGIQFMLAVQMELLKEYVTRRHYRAAALY